jgi:hypothetical protein
MSSYDIVARNSAISDLEWLECIVDVLKDSDFFNYLAEDEEVLENAANAPRKRKYIFHNRTTDLWSTPWGLMLKQLANISDINSFEHRKFRRRFRVPFSMFLEIVKECEEGNVFGVTVRKNKIAIDFKVLASLKILGRDLCCDEIDERLNISESHTLFFFKQFVNNYSKVFFDKYVYVARGSDLQSVMEVYRRMGFPGCVGSMDVTHIYWDKCPNYLRFLCKGKEGNQLLHFRLSVITLVVFIIYQRRFLALQTTSA